MVEFAQFEVMPHVSLYLYPGQLFASAEAHRITTILGSCVAVCLWDAKRGGGGMNHYLLPGPSGGAGSPRYADAAIPRLIERLEAIGIRREDLRAMIFGGASVIAVFRTGDREHLGEKNVAMARSILRAAGIPVVSEDVGGQQGRRLVFDTGDGSVFVRPIETPTREA